MNSALLIPAFNPDEKLVKLVQECRHLGFNKIVVVNDGSSLEQSRAVFAHLKHQDLCVVLNHAINLGKGAALKTGFNYVYCEIPDAFSVVTADADGQHLPKDIFRVAQKTEETINSIIIGGRQFKGDVPVRSQIGNILTRWIFKFLVGKKLKDTQSGLRGIPKVFLPNLIKIRANKYDYELDVLIKSRVFNWSLEEIPIETVYIDSNKGSHFNPLLDSMKIYFVFLRFISSSLITVFVDYACFLVLLNFISTSLFSSTIIARVIAAIFNFLLARKYVFQSKSNLLRSLLGFSALVLAHALITYSLVLFLKQELGVNVIVAKVGVEIFLCVVNFLIQRDLIFNVQESKQK